MLSTGHSGSTLLDYVIGSIPGVFSTGELTHLPWQLDRGRNEPEQNSFEYGLEKQNICSCLRNFWHCPIWSRVVERYGEKVGLNIAKDPYLMHLPVLRPMKYDTNPLPTRVKNSLLRLAVMLGTRSNSIAWMKAIVASAYRLPIENNWHLFDSICEVSDASHVVDSTKDLFRCLLLSEKRSDESRVIALVRDANGVAASNQKLGKDPIAAANHWVRYYNRIATLILDRSDLPLLVVKYEELVRDAERERQRIAEFLELSVPASPMSLRTNEAHLVAGNPMRYRGEIEIREDRRWKDALDSTVAARITQISNQLDVRLRS